MSFDRRNTLDDDDDDDAIDSDIGMTVKAIVLDDGFWQSITEMLHVAMPIIKLLRLLDSNKARDRQGGGPASDGLGKGPRAHV